MGFIELVMLRKSVRSFKGQEDIDTRTLNRILDAGRLAPSAKNLQEWKFVIVRDKSMLSKLVVACKGQSFISDAAAVIVGCSDKTDYIMTCGQPAYTVDLAIALEHMSLMATELGVGSCWIGAFHEAQVKELLGIPLEVRVVSLLVLGVPSIELSKMGTTTRKDLDEIVCYDTWSF